MVAEMWPEPAGGQPARVVPSPGPFAGLLGQPYQRLKVAVLRELAVLPRPTWPLAEAEQALTWLEPVTASRLVGELRADGLVVEAGPGRWRLSDEAHLVAAVCAVLAVPSIEPDRAVRVLGAAVALARAVGLGEPAASAPLAAAAGVLQADLDTLARLLGAGAADDAELLAAARLAATHAADADQLLGQAGPAAARPPAWRRLGELAGRLGTLAGEVESGLAAPDEPPPAGVDGAALRGLAAAVDVDTLAGLVAGGRLQLPPAVPPVRASAALAALDDLLGRPEPVAVPLPEPVMLPIEPPDAIPDFVQIAADALAWLGGLDDGDLTRWVVGGSWPEAAARMAAVVEAWSRWGPSGDGSLAAALDPEPAFELVGRDEVGIVSRTGVRPADGERVIDLTEPAEVAS
jgi:hypothetical protein